MGDQNSNPFTNQGTPFGPGSVADPFKRMVEEEQRRKKAEADAMVLGSQQEQARRDAAAKAAADQVAADKTAEQGRLDQGAAAAGSASDYETARNRLFKRGKGNNLFGSFFGG